MTRYVKKEDVGEVLRNQRIGNGLTYILLSMAMLVQHLAIRPHIVKLYDDFRVEMPQIVEMSGFLMVGLAVAYMFAGIMRMRSQDNNSKINALMKKYKKGEMIHMRELSNPNFVYEIVFMLLLFFFVTYFSIVKPIYDLTALV